MIQDKNKVDNLLDLEAIEQEMLMPVLGSSDDYGDRAGAIRPGIMVLKKEDHTERNEKIYNELIAQGLRFDEIDKALGPGEDNKSKLTPMNVDYFTVRPNDCLDPGHAKRIMDMYADKDGKLRSFPVWFNTNDLWEIIPHNLECRVQSRIQHRTNVIQECRDGRIMKTRVCETSDVRPGIRPTAGMPWTQKECDPESCDLYQIRQCTLHGCVKFMIPGIEGDKVWVIPTTSFNSLHRIKGALQRISHAAKGRVADIIVDNKPICMIQRVQADVSSINKQTGERRLKKQWLTELGATIDLFDLVKKNQAENIPTRGSAVADLLSAGNVVNLDQQRSRQKKASVTIQAEEPIQQEKTPEDKQPEKAEETPPVQAETDKSAKQKSSSSNKSDTKSAKPPNGDGPLKNQLDAIDKLAKKFQVPDALLMEEKKKLRTQGDAGALIRQLNKGDLSRFIPAA